MATTAAEAEATKTLAAKRTTKKTTPAAATKCIYTIGIYYDPTWPYRKRQWFNKEWNLADTRLR